MTYPDINELLAWWRTADVPAEKRDPIIAELERIKASHT